MGSALRSAFLALVLVTAPGCFITLGASAGAAAGGAYVVAENDPVEADEVLRGVAIGAAIGAAVGWLVGELFDSVTPFAPGDRQEFRRAPAPPLVGPPAPPSSKVR